MTAAPDDRELLARFVEIWRDAAARLCDLARSLPEEPERFSDGIPAAIWV